MNVYNDITKDFGNYLPKVRSDMERFLDRQGYVDRNDIRICLNDKGLGTPEVTFAVIDSRRKNVETTFRVGRDSQSVSPLRHISESDLMSDYKYVITHNELKELLISPHQRVTKDVDSPTFGPVSDRIDALGNTEISIKGAGEVFNRALKEEGFRPQPLKLRTPNI